MHLPMTDETKGILSRGAAEVVSQGSEDCQLCEGRVGGGGGVAQGD